MEFPAALIAKIQRAHQITVFTGAGISAESGVPTFRDAQTGLWANYDPLELATPEAFQQNPDLVWSWYQWRRNLISQKDPNPGHRALASLEGMFPGFTLITQNVDGLHQKAGSKKVIELHGNIFRDRCSLDGRLFGNRDSSERNKPPTCPGCGNLLRPDVVWFGETLPPEALERSIQASAQGEVFFSIGTSTQVEPAASMPFIALKAGRTVVEINPAITTLSSRAHYRFEGLSGEILPELLAHAQEASGKETL